MILLGTLYGIHSDRQLCKNIHFNLVYRWFVRISLKNRVPDHSSLTRIRDRLREDVFHYIFEKILEQCKQTGLLTAKKLMMDSTLAEANASRLSLKRVIPIKRAKQGEGVFTANGLKYDATQDYLTCPAGHKLYLYDKPADGGSKYYRLLGGHCNNCSFRKTCIPERSTKKNKVCLRHPTHDEIEKVKVRCQIELFKSRLHERQ